MSLKEIINELNEQEPTFLEEAPKKVNGQKTYICPLCKNGSGKDGDGITLYINQNQHRYYKCFCCELHEDIIGLWRIISKCSFKGAIFQLQRYYGMNNLNGEFKNVNKSVQYEKNTVKKVVKKDYTYKIKKYHKDVIQTPYFKERGLSDKIINKYELGYIPCYISENTGEVKNLVVIPTSENSIVIRNIDPNCDKKDRYKKIGENNIYLENNLYDSNTPVFITEGELDALSIIEAGGVAVALGSAGNYNKLIKTLKEKRPTQPLILALDNDEIGMKITDVISKKLDEMNIKYEIIDIYGEYKDANEILVADRRLLEENIKKVNSKYIL